MLLVVVFCCAGGEEARALSLNYSPAPNSYSLISRNLCFKPLTREYRKSTGEQQQKQNKQKQEKGLTSSQTVSEQGPAVSEFGRKQSQPSELRGSGAPDENSKERKKKKKKKALAAKPLLAHQMLHIT